MSRDFAFLHAADIHIDSPLTGLSAKNEEFSKVVRGATRRAFSNLVDLAVSEQVDFVVIAGDLYDGTWKDQSTGQYAASQLARLSRAGIRAFIVFGNHDAESRISRHLTPPDGVHLLDNRKCQSIPLDDLGVAIHGRSYKDAATIENIAQTYCPPTPGLFNLAILHTALDGHPGHQSYAPCTLDELRSAGHDYWALGHVHDAAIRSREPYIVYPGNTQGRHVRETGAKGVMLVRVADGAVAGIEARPCDEARWAQAEVDAREAKDMPELLAAVAEALRAATDGAADRPTAARLNVKAHGTLRRPLLADPEWFSAEVQGQASMISGDLWIESVRLDPGDAEDELSPELSELLAGADESEDCVRAIRSAVKPIIDKLPSEITNGELAPLLTAARAGDVTALLSAARRALAPRLTGVRD